MSRYRGPRLKKIRRLGALPGLTRKTPKSGSNLKKNSILGKRSNIIFVFKKNRNCVFIMV
uniref:Ribosomal protein S4 n=1 Tax=Aegilops tauschii subsp. strangulata TaxID=200361 RepID=A0A452YMB3_AEGTS